MAKTQTGSARPHQLFDAANVDEDVGCGHHSLQSISKSIITYSSSSSSCARVCRGAVDAATNDNVTLRHGYRLNWLLTATAVAWSPK